MSQRLLSQADYTLSNSTAAYVVSRIFDTFFIVPITFFIIATKASAPVQTASILFLLNCLLPLVFFIYLHACGHVVDIDITHRKRPVWFSGMAFCWLLGYIVTNTFLPVPSPLGQFQVWLVIWGFWNAAITRAWETSGHMVIATNFVCWMARLIDPTCWLLLPILLPLVVWSRWQLSQQTVAQLVASVVFVLSLNLSFFWFVTNL